MVKPTIWFIHGASSTPRSFNWLCDHLPDHQRVNISYKDHEFGDLVPALLKEAKHSAPFHIIGHSLGGVVAVYLAQRCSAVQKVVTMAAPFGGSELATYLRFFSPDPILCHAHPYSRLITGVRRKRVKKPVLSVVTTAGRLPLTLMYRKNDGVVTYASQTAIAGPVYEELEVNHFEVLLAEETARLTTEFLWAK